MRAALAALFLAACAAPSSGEYHQSAFPPAPTFNPAWDAPHTVGQPGYVGEPEKAPRSPYTRTLPQTPETRREAGIWAAKSSDLPPLPTVVGISVPVPTGDDVLDYVVPLAKCAASSDDALRQIGAGGYTIHQYAMQQPQEQRKCLAAKLLASCARAAQSMARSPDARAERMSAKAADALAAYVTTLLERWCEGVNLDPTLTKAHRAVEKFAFPRLETQ